MHTDAALTIDALPWAAAIVSFQRAKLELAATLRLRREVLPEERVGNEPSAVEFEGRLELDLFFRGGGLRVCLLGSVEAVHVRLVVLAVVQLHNLARDKRLEGLVARMLSALVGWGESERGRTS